MNRSRVTGDLASHGNIFVDIANDRVGIGSTIPGQKLSLPDSAKIALGNSADLEIYHDGSHSYIHDGGTGNLKLRSNNFRLSNADESKVSATFVSSGAVDLYFNNNLRLSSANYGANIFGQSAAVSFGLYTEGGTKRGGLYATNGNVISLLDAQDHQILRGVKDGAAELYHDNTKTFSTNSLGISVYQRLVCEGTAPSILLSDTNHQSYTITADANALTITDANNGNRLGFNANGSISAYGFFNCNNSVYAANGFSTNGNIDIDDDGDKLRIGAGNDLQIYHSTFNYIESYNDAEIHINANTGGSVENMAKFKPNGAVELYHNNTKMFETTSFGSQTVFSSTDGDVSIFKVLHGNLSQGIGFGYNTILSTGSNTNISLTLRSKGSFPVNINTSGGAAMASFTPSGAANLYHNGTLTTRTTSYGAEVYFNSTGGNIPILKVAHSNATQGVGIGYDSIVSTGSNTNIPLNIRSKGSSNIQLSTSTEELMARFTPNGAVELYHNNVKKAYTQNNGFYVTDTGQAAMARVLAPTGYAARFDMTSDAGASHEDNYRIEVGTDQIFKIQGKPSGNYTTLFTMNQSGNATFQNNVTITKTGDPILTVTGSGHPQLTLTNTSGSDHCGVNFGDSSDHNAGMIQYTNNGDYMVFHTAGVERIRIKGDGKIRLDSATANTIHTSSDASKIAIFAGSTDSVSNGGVIAVTGVNHSAGCFTDVSAGAGGHTQFRIGTSEKVRINSSGMVVFKGGTGGTDQIKIESQGGGTGIYIANFQGVSNTGDTGRLGVGKNDNALIFTNASGSQISNFAIGNTDSIPLVLSTANTKRLVIAGNGQIGIGQDSNGNVSTRAILELNAPYSDVSDNDGSADLGTNGHDALLINISGPSAASGKNVGSIAWGGSRRRAAIMAEYQNTDADFLALAFFTRGSDGPNDFFKSFIINHNGSAGLHGSLSQNTSDDRLKKDKVEITNALDKVNSLSSFTHKWNDIAVRAGLEEGKEEIGLSAQEVQGLYPSLVSVNNVMKDPENPDVDYLTVHYEKVVPLLVASIKELTAKNKALEARLDALEGS